jgi:hypothetical protein
MLSNVMPDIIHLATAGAVAGRCLLPKDVGRSLLRGLDHPNMARPGLREMPNDRESGPQPGLSSCDEAAHGPPKKLFRIPTKRA